MTNSIIEAISISLNEEFGDGYEIHMEEIKQEMLSAGALGAMMSGSGPTVFGLFEDNRKAIKAQERIRKKALGRQVYIASVHSAGRDK